MLIRPIKPEEYERAGELVVAAYRNLPDRELSADYAAELADVGRRAQGAEVLVAVSQEPETEDELLGCATLVSDASSEWAELLEAGEAEIRMLAVLPAAQRRGVGRALVDTCISRARALGMDAVLLHTTPWMHSAHRLYEAVGFERFPARDWQPVPEVPLIAYRLPIG